MNESVLAQNLMYTGFNLVHLCKISHVHVPLLVRELVHMRLYSVPVDIRVPIPDSMGAQMH